MDRNLSQNRKLKSEFSKKKIFILDLDGTIYKGNELIPNADKFVKDLEDMGKIVIYFTNNATKSPFSFIKKLNSMNIKCKPHQLISSGIIASKMLYNQLDIRTIYVIGSPELIELMENSGLSTLNSTVDNSILYADWLDKYLKCDAVVVAMDVKVTYEKIRTAQELINRGAEFYATNGDKTFPESRQIWPGAGMIVAAVEATVGRPPKIIFGKPNPIGIDLLFEELNKNKEKFRKDNTDISHNYTKNDAVIIGDRLETDILQANYAKVDSILVESGIHHRKDIPQEDSKNYDKNLVPKYIIENLMELFE